MLMNKSSRLLCVSATLCALAALCFLSLTSCSAKRKETVSDSSEASHYPVTVVDQLGRSVTIEKEPQSIVSGYYISTSILMALDLEKQLTGIEAKADKRAIYRLAAPGLLSLPNVGSAKQFDLEGCIALKPDLIILPRKQKDTAETLESLGFSVLIIDPENEARLTDAVTLIGKAANREQKAAELTDTIASVRSDLSEKTRSAVRPRVLITGNSGVLSAAGGKMFQSELIELAGGENAAAELADTSWAEISYEQLLKWDPEVIVLAGEAGYTADDVLKDPNLSVCAAIRNKRVCQFPSAAESLDSPVPAGIYGALWLAGVLHPELVSETEYLHSIQDFYRSYYDFEYAEN